MVTTEYLLVPQAMGFDCADDLVLSSEKQETTKEQLMVPIAPEDLTNPKMELTHRLKLRMLRSW